MGVTAVVSSASVTEGVSAVTSLVTTVGFGVGGVFVAALLVFLLAYLNLFDASGWENQRVKVMLVSTVLPLSVTFGAILLFQSLQAI